MKNKTIWITTLICLLPLVVSFIVYDKLPEQVAIHFNEAGVPDNYASRAFAAFVLPVIMAAINLFTHFFVRNDPKAANISASLRVISQWVVPALSVVIIPVTLFMAMGTDIPIPMLVSSMVGVIIVLCGNYLPKCRQNYTVGIKLPWTLNSEENWRKTHRFAGFVWVTGGLLFVINAFTGIPVLSFVVIALLAALPVIYSYLFYLREKKAV